MERATTLLDDCDILLYPSCVKFSCVSFLLRLYHFKALLGWSAKSLSCLLEFLNEAFPNGNTIPTTYYEAKKNISELNLGYVKIDACPNDCMLYWGNASKKISCDTSQSMRWHKEGRTKDGILRHPANGSAWDTFDKRFLDFAFNPRNACMKQSSMILSMVIPGEKGPGNDIDVYMQPLIKELKQLWTRVDAFDSSASESFTLRDCLLWTINDFPAYANLSGWSTKGRVACPNLDVMHIEKNICDNVIGTLLNLSHFGKDNIKARKDLQNIGIRSYLHPKVRNEKEYLPQACYTLASKERDIFPSIVKNMKVLDGYASNISRCVNLKEYKLSNLKSHDSHILMQDRGVVKKKVLCVITNLSDFFKRLYVKSLDPQEVDQLQIQVVLTLCEMEKIFPPSFFTIMIHLIIHLPMEAKLGGPVQYRCMYPIERYLMGLKASVRNRVYPEGSIPEGYIVSKCLTFCSRYFSDMETIFSRPPRNIDGNIQKQYIFSSGGRLISTMNTKILDMRSLAQENHYEFFESEQAAYGGIQISKLTDDKWLVETFPKWLAKQIPKIEVEHVDADIIALARGPHKVVSTYDGLIINGFRVHTKKHEQHRKTQNSGVMVFADGRNYYCNCIEIIELNYCERFWVIMLRCDWVNIKSPRSMKNDANGFIMVKFSKLILTVNRDSDDPYILASQAKKVFYVKDGKSEGWLHVIAKRFVQSKR
ncbi:uncharacterized protein [Gossypium hirsutum]|uniref:DUF4218 domain-containing protein n=1 Tax=Gossypium hirsutum TaxID=3635 RepID=A0ABM3AZG2_GOSHI|nr:uncharacterized protein LOC107910991 [Gossypium hirsutum]